MGKILIITDQPVYEGTSKFISTSSVFIEAVFAGDIFDVNEEVMGRLRFINYDTILLSDTITHDTDIGDAVFKFIDEKMGRNENCVFSYHANKY